MEAPGIGSERHEISVDPRRAHDDESLAFGRRSHRNARHRIFEVRAHHGRIGGSQIMRSDEGWLRKDPVPYGPLGSEVLQRVR